jgi:Tfp pilus assembly protein PilF
MPRLFSKHSRTSAVAALSAMALLFSTATHRAAPFSFFEKETPATMTRGAVVDFYCYDGGGHQTSAATGFLVSPDGLIVTARHVIQGHPYIIIGTARDQYFPVEGVLAQDPVHDTVVVQIRGNKLPYIDINTIANIQKGSPVQVVCAHFEFGGKIINGTVAGTEDLADDYRWYSVDAWTREGESGSPMIDPDGHLAGMVTAYLNNHSLAFVVPADTIRRLVNFARTQQSTPLPNFPARQWCELYQEPDLKRAITDSQKGDALSAAHDITNICAAFPQTAALYAMLGTCYEKLRQLPQAETAYLKAISLEPGYGLGYACLATVLASENRQVDAWNAVKQAKQAAALEHPAYPDILFNLGATYMMLHQPDLAKEMLKELQTINTPSAAKMAAQLSKGIELYQ